jgi:glycosyltransferase 2 family protein
MVLNVSAPNRFITLLIVIITLIGLVLIASDWQEMRQVLLKADWHYVPLALLFTLFSYAFYSYAYAIVARTLGIGMRKRELAEVCFISTVVNHVLTTGGVVGYSLRYFLMKMYKVTLRDVLTSSLLHFYITSLDMLTFLPISIIYLLQHATIPRGLVIALGAMTAVFSLILILSTILVFFPSRRRRVISMVIHFGRKFIRRDWLTWMLKFDDTLTCGTEAFRNRPLILVGVMLLTLLDFASSIIAMGFVFEALGPPLKAGVLVSGYVIGIMAGLISMVPGGLGVQEGSMASIYALLGATFGQAVLAAILFRILYYFLPYLLILPFYNRLLIKARQHPSIQV